MVSLKKKDNESKVKEGNYLPLSSAPYQLSVTFANTFHCRYQYQSGMGTLPIIAAVAW